MSLFPTVRGLDRKIPSGSVFLYIRFLKLAPSEGASFSCVASNIVARAKRGRVVEDELEKLNRRHGTTGPAPLEYTPNLNDFL